MEVDKVRLIQLPPPQQLLPAVDREEEELGLMLAALQFKQHKPMQVLIMVILALVALQHLIILELEVVALEAQDRLETLPVEELEDLVLPPLSLEPTIIMEPVVVAAAVVLQQLPVSEVVELVVMAEV
jgi:hypothetical protein